MKGLLQPPLQPFSKFDLSAHCPPNRQHEYRFGDMGWHWRSVLPVQFYPFRPLDDAPPGTHTHRQIAGLMKGTASWITPRATELASGEKPIFP